MIDWEYINNKRQRYEKSYAIKMLGALRRTILPIIQESRKSIDGNIPVDMLINDEHIKKAYYELYLKVGKAFIKDFIRNLKSYEDDLWEIEMMRYINDLAGNEITLVTNYTKETIRKALKKVMDSGMENGISVGEIMKNLRTELTKGNYSTFTKARALRIAKTEVMTASNAGSYVAANMNGMREKVWLTAPFGIAKDERHNLMGMNGQRRSMDQPFDLDSGIQMMHPGDSSLGAGADNIVNCNCGLTYA